MFRKVRLISICLLSVILIFSCIKKTSGKELEENLKTAMGQFLNNSPRVDTANAKFYVQEVSFYEGPKAYICEFKVNLKQKMPDRLVDTIGYMKADVSKDFKTVTRKN